MFAGAAVIQPALLTGSVPPNKKLDHSPYDWWRPLLLLLTAVLTISACCLAYKLYRINTDTADELSNLSSDELYSELVQWRTRLHGRAAGELHAFLSTNLILLTKVRQSLEALSGVILSDMAQNSPVTDVPNETAFS
ncbi:hypothetical protein evm_011865 [Chilo suppressalis]|nr:hypothetical protein evm_011865 [Chilo suppressalis]